MPSPARRIGTSVSFLPLTRWPIVRSSGVSTGAASSARSLVASYAMSIAISSTSSLKIFVGVARSRSMRELVLHERVRDDAQRGIRGGGVHGGGSY